MSSAPSLPTVGDVQRCKDVQILTFPADLIIFTEEICDAKLHFFVTLRQFKLNLMIYNQTIINDTKCVLLKCYEWKPNNKTIE